MALGFGRLEAQTMTGVFYFSVEKALVSVFKGFRSPQKCNELYRFSFRNATHVPDGIISRGRLVWVVSF